MISTQRRVVISGMGAISPLGNTKAALWEALVAGRSGVGPLGLSGEGADAIPIHAAAEVKQFSGQAEDFGPLDKEQKKTIRKALKAMCRECQMGAAVAQLTLTDAGLGLGKCDPDRIGVNFGVDHMLTVPEEFIEGARQCLDSEGQFEFTRWAGDGLPKMSPLWLLKYLPNMPASHVAIFNDLRGPNNSMTLREAAANAALGEAFQVILRGSADAMLVGATGSRMHSLKLIHALQQEEVSFGDGDPARLSRPFDRDRTGMVLGEGAAAVMLEELGAAEARGAAIFGEVIAAASSAAAGEKGDSPHLPERPGGCFAQMGTVPFFRRFVARRQQALTNVLRSVLHAADVGIDDIGHVHAHAAGTHSGDIEEARAIAAVFGGRRRPLPVVAAKGHFGHLGAGSGMVELIASVLALQHGHLFPVLNYQTPDPECPVAAVRDASTPSGESFINLSVTPQGQASAVLIRRWK